MSKASRSQTMIEGAGLHKVYWDGCRQLEVLKNVSINIRRGEGVAVLGPSGSGKTTLLNVLSGLDRPDKGAVRLGGHSLHTLPPRKSALLRNQKMGFVFQFYHLLPELNALENVLLPAWMARDKRTRGQKTARARDLLGRIGLADRFGHYPAELSGGEQQRVAIARALVNDPEIVFCDEPTGNLDAELGREVGRLIQNLFREEGKTVLVVTHDERIAKITDRVWDMRKGDWRS